MIVSTRCGNCQSPLDYDPGDLKGPLSCPSCEAEAKPEVSDSILQENRVDVCPQCGGEAFYIQRDFNQKLGVGIMAVFALVGLVFVAFDRPLLFYVCLASGAVLDLALYRLLPEITVCYKCKAAFRDASRNPDHEPFDLHIADHYDGRSQG